MFRENLFKNLSVARARMLAAQPYEKHQDRIFILTPTASGSLGDEAMVRAAVSELQARSDLTRVCLVVWSDVDLEAYSDLDVEFLEIGALLSRPFGVRTARFLLFKQLGAALKKLRYASHLFVLGADVLDGKYSETRSVRRVLMAELGCALNVKTSIVGFSFSDKATKRTRQAMESLPQSVRLACRDPHSASRVQLLAKRPVEQNADLAFLLRPHRASDPEFASALHDIDNWRSSGKSIIAININRQAFGGDIEVNPENAIAAYQRLIVEIARHDDAAFLFLPHDFRGQHSDEVLLRRLMERVQGDLQVLMVGRKIRADEAKYLTGCSDLTITGRMHLAIASLGMCTPALVHDYQGKVGGLLSLFDLYENSFTTREVISTERILKKYQSVMARRAEIEREIGVRLPNIKALARRNIDAL